MRATKRTNAPDAAGHQLSVLCDHRADPKPIECAAPRMTSFDSADRDSRPERWPPETPSTPSDVFYLQLIDAVSVAPEVWTSAKVWVEGAMESVLDAVRPHALDVDALICGSFATKTHLYTAPWDIDLVLRFRERRRGWDVSAGAALEDVTRWLSHAFEASIRPNKGTVRLAGSGALTLDILPAWRAPDEPGGLWSAGTSDLGGRGLRLDPAGHRDLVRARNACLGHDSAFIKLIRIVKHLNHRWAYQYPQAPVSSFHIECLALHLCTAPFVLAEGVSDFLRAASRRLLTPLEDPLHMGPPLVAPDPEFASRLFSEAASGTEEALMTDDAPSVRKALTELFGDPIEFDRSRTAAA
jgi:hypothetical protein